MNPSAVNQPTPGPTGPIGNASAQSGPPQARPGTKIITPPGKKKNANSTQNTLQIAEIRDGIVIMNDGSFRSVVMVKSINFDLMSPQEQEAVEYSYQGFLNSLVLPDSDFCPLTKIDLQPYIQKLDKIRTEHDNMLLALLMEDYIGYIDDLSQQTNIMDKKFYVVIPFFPLAESDKPLDSEQKLLHGAGELFNNKEQHVRLTKTRLEKAKTELRNRVQAVLAGLLQCEHPRLAARYPGANRAVLRYLQPGYRHPPAT